MRTPNFIESILIESNESCIDKSIPEIIINYIGVAIQIVTYFIMKNPTPPIPPKPKFKEGGLVKGNSNGELVNLPVDSVMLDPEIAKLLGKGLK
jgi:hypothetical protein